MYTYKIWYVYILPTINTYHLVNTKKISKIYREMIYCMNTLLWTYIELYLFINNMFTFFMIFHWHEDFTQVSKAADQSIAFPWKPCVDRGEDQGKHPRRPWPRRTVVVRPVDKFDKWENYGKLLGWGVFISPVQLKQYKVLLSKWGHEFSPKFLGWKWSKTNDILMDYTHPEIPLWKMNMGWDG